MCGLAGILGPEIKRSTLQDMGHSQRHRGPDEDGVWTAGNIGFAHTRLRIIDPTEAAAQPMWTSDNRWSLIYNGEVYNYGSLRDQLCSSGYHFRSVSDTEVVLYAWAEWGPKALDRLEGMFAFGVWDRKECLLWLARDRSGIKPLYWHHDGTGSFFFASEVRALLASGRIDRRLDRSVLPFYLSQQTAPTPRTLVEGVRMMPPGCFAKVRLERGRATPPEIRRYWNPLSAVEKRRDNVAVRSRSELVVGLRDRVKSAVERRLVADVPLGAFLSGGVDSTAGVALMAEVAHDPVRTFTVVFEEEDRDDGPYARLAAERIGTDHYEVVLTEEELVEAMPATVRAQDDPSGDGINTWIVSRAARVAGLTVNLSGLGGDELFGGYPSFPRMRLLARPAPLRGVLPESLARSLGRLTGTLGSSAPDGKLPDLASSDGSVTAAYPVLRRLFSSDRITALTGSDRLEPYATLSDRLRDDLRAHPTTPLLARVAYAEITSYMRDVLLRDTDQMSMSHSLELRVSLLDRELVEYALAMPEVARRPTDPPKRWLVEAVGERMPEKVANRPKSGFALPFYRWMRGPLRGYCREGIEAAAAHPAFRADPVHAAWEDVRRGAFHRSRPWLLVALGRWLEREEIR